MAVVDARAARACALLAGYEGLTCCRLPCTLERRHTVYGPAYMGHLAASTHPATTG